MATATKANAGKVPARLASGTTKSPDDTETEIKKYLRSRGAEDPIVIATDPAHNRIIAIFKMFGKTVHVRQNLANPDGDFINRPKNSRGGYTVAPTKADIAARLEAETRRRWRVLLTKIKTKIDIVFDNEDVSERAAEFADEFMLDVVVPGGGTVRESVSEQMKEAYKTGKPPRVLPAPGAYKLLEDEG